MIRNSLANAVGLGLALLVGTTASAQTNRQGGQSDASNPRTGAQRQKDAGQNQGPTETIRGELAGATVLGENMVDHDTGRAATAEFTYLTILGSPAGNDRSSGRDESGRNNQDNAASGKDRADQGANRAQADDERGERGRDRDRQGRRSGERRVVYQIAIGPNTQVRDRTAQERQGSDDRRNGQEERRSGREQSQSALERLELGDRVEVEFTRIESHDQGRSGNQARHGRHRIVHGVARTVTILSTPDQADDSRSSEGRRGDDPSSRSRRAEQKDSNQDR